MYKSRGLNAIASVTELRTDTTDVLAAANDKVVGIQKNNEVAGVLVGWNLFLRIRGSLKEAGIELEDL